MTTRKRADVSNVLQDSPAVTSTVSGTDLPVTSMSRQVPATSYSLRVHQALRRIIRAVDLHSRQLLGQHEITGPQLITLLTIESNEPVTASAIAGHIHLSPSTVIGILDRLETKGLIQRDRDLKDRRLVQVSLTEQGKVLATNAPSPLQGTLAEAMGKLPETELLMIAESLERIVGLMQMQHVDDATILETGPIDPVSGDTGARGVYEEQDRSIPLKYETANKAKACFDDVYTEPTPHDYIAMMSKTGYEIVDQARPYCIAAAELLTNYTEDARPVQMLDIGCSYGMGSAFLKYGCSFDEMVAFFSTRAPKDPNAASEAMRAWINVTPTPLDLRCVGLDSSKPAIDFAMRAGLLDGGIARDFENPDITPNPEERSWLRSCNLLISTGAIGYVTDRTMAHVVRHAGKDHPSEFGPLAVLTILRMFDATPIKNVFEKHGYRFEKVPEVMLPQRSFADENERKSVLKILHDKGIDTSEWEDRGKQFAELFIAAKPEHFQELLEKMIETHSMSVHDESEGIAYNYR